VLGPEGGNNIVGRNGRCVPFLCKLQVIIKSLFVRMWGSKCQGLRGQ
jgi:hypothetical protein